MVLLQQREIVDQALQVSPYNGLAYGLLVVILMVVIVAQWRRNKTLEERHYDYVERTVAVMQLVEGKIDGISDLDNKVTNLGKEITEIRREVQDVKGEI